MNQKLWQRAVFRLSLSLGLLLWVIWPWPASAGAMTSAGYSRARLEEQSIPMSPVPTLPTAIMALDFTALAAGSSHTCALVSDGGVTCWGDNGSGQLGDGTTTSRRTPVDVVGLGDGVTAIAVGGYHTCALVGSGRPKCWGWDGVGQLGIGTITQRLTPVDVVESVPLYLTANYPDGQPGSFFTVTGWNFPADGQATLDINGLVLTAALMVNPTGSFILFLDTSVADAGGYVVTASVDASSASASFILDEGAPLRPQEGGGLTFAVPAGIAIVFDTFVYFPLVRR